MSVKEPQVGACVDSVCPTTNRSRDNTGEGDHGIVRTNQPRRGGTVIPGLHAIGRPPKATRKGVGGEIIRHHRCRLRLHALDRVERIRIRVSKGPRHLGVSSHQVADPCDPARIRIRPLSGIRRTRMTRTPKGRTRQRRTTRTLRPPSLTRLRRRPLTRESLSVASELSPRSSRTIEIVILETLRTIELRRGSRGTVHTIDNTRDNTAFGRCLGGVGAVGRC